MLNVVSNTNAKIAKLGILQCKQQQKQEKKNTT
jgi:hypothetical protein